LVTALVIASALGYSWLRVSPSLRQVEVTVVFVFPVIGLAAWLLIRRVGIDIQPDALVLRGVVQRVTISWDRVEGLVWREMPSLTQTEYLYVEFDQKSARRLPTVAKDLGRRQLNDRYLGPVFTSPNLRSATGEEVDADEILGRAWALGRERQTGVRSS
jgi:hypothetical protein